MSKFKVGDKVRYLGNSDNRLVNPGAVGTISDIGNIILLCEDWSSTPETENSCYIYVNECELVEPKSDNERLLAGLNREIGGTKNDSAKPDLSLIPTDAIWGTAKALSYGARKYDRHNFRKGIQYSRLVAACMRHLTAWNEGENFDSESGLSHIDHAMATLAMLKFMEVNKPEMDDRFKVEKKSITQEALDKYPENNEIKNGR